MIAIKPEYYVGLIVNTDIFVILYSTKHKLTHLPQDKMAIIQFADDMQWLFMNEKFCKLIQISLKFVPKSPIDNKSALVRVMTLCRTGNKTLRTNADPVHWRIYAALGGDELI